MAKKKQEIVETTPETMSRGDRKRAEKLRKKQEAQQRAKELRAQQKKKVAKQETAKTLQATIPYRKAYSNGIIETAKGIYTKSYLLKDVNYQAAKLEAQHTMFQKYAELLNTFDASMTFQISVNNRNIDIEQFKENTLIELQEDGLNVYRNEYNDMLVDKMAEGKNNMVRDKYLTVSTPAESYKAACNIFSRLDTEITSATKKIGGSEATPLSTLERLEIIHNLLNIGKENEFEANKEDPEMWLRNLTMRGLDTKDIVVPSGIEFQKNHMIIGDKYARVLYLKELPNFMPDVIISELTDCDHNMITSMDIAIVPQDKAIKIVKSQMVNIGANIVDRQKKAVKSGYDPSLTSPDLMKAQEEANELLDQLTTKDQKMFQMTLVIMHFADSLEQLDKDTASIQAVGRKYSCEIKSLFSQQELGFKSVLPVCYNQLLLKRTLTTASTAVFMPFTSQELNQKHGHYYGLNAISRNMILFNRESCKNGNGFILGTPGCVDKDTEFFNGKEWKSIADYVEGEKVLQFDTETGIASLVLPERYIKAPCDKMYHFETKYGINQTLSGEHRVIYYKRYPKTNTYSSAMEMSAAELAEVQNKGEFRGKFKTDFKYNGPGIELSDGELKIMLAVICDGSFNKNNPKSFNCVVRLKKDRKKKELFKLLSENHVEFRVHEDLKGYTQFSFKAPKREKDFLPYWYNCSADQLKLICDNILQWDGSIDRKGRRTFSTTVKSIADFVQFAFSSCGYRATVYEKNRDGEHYITNGKTYVRKHTEYTVCISDNVMVGMEWHNDGRETNVIVEEVTPVDGMKYCFTVPTHALVLRRNGKIFITGNSGKSFTSKQNMVNIILGTDDDIIIIDPENEYSPLIELLGGEVISIDAGGANHINPFDMDAAYAGEKGKNPLVLKTDFIISLCDTVGGGYAGLTPSQMSIIDRCVRAVYSEYLASEYIDENGEKCYDASKTPTLLEFQQLLASQKDREAKEIALALELYTSGSLDNFAHKTNVDVNNRFLAYNLRDVGDNMMNMAMLTVTNTIWNRILKNHRLGKKTWVFVDEAHLLFANRTSATFMKTLYKRSRKFNGYITSITQNVTDILDNPICKTMIGNSEFLILLNQSADDRDRLAEQLSLSETQLDFITSANPGEGLLINSPTIIPFINKFPQDTQLYRAMTTKPSDIAKYKAEKAAVELEEEDDVDEE